MGQVTDRDQTLAGETADWAMLEAGMAPTEAMAGILVLISPASEPNIRKQTRILVNQGTKET